MGGEGFLSRVVNALFRVRLLLHGVIFTLGFWAPWNRIIPLDPAGLNAHVWGLLSVNLSQAHWMSITSAFNLLLVLGILFALGGALLRTWGAAYIGAGVVQSAGLHVASSAALLHEDGPYRHVRNPLYLGTILHTVALALLMPRSGAIFAIVAITLLQWVLVVAEESFLSARLGQTFSAYCALVPRFIPSLRARIQGRGEKPQWPQAFLGEIYMWLVAISYAVAGWQYNARVLMQCVVVAFGVSLVARALIAKPGAGAAEVSRAEG